MARTHLDGGRKREIQVWVRDELREHMTERKLLREMLARLPGRAGKGRVPGQHLEEHGPQRYQPAIDLAQEFVSYLTVNDHQYGFIKPDGKWTAVHNSTGHNANYLLGLVEYALAVNDTALLDWAYKSFASELHNRNAIEAMGFFPEYPAPYTENGATYRGNGGEICQVATITDLAVKFSAAQVGDHWDDVDRWVRNHLIESQLDHGRTFLRERLEWLQSAPSPPALTALTGERRCPATAYRERRGEGKARSRPGDRRLSSNYAGLTGASPLAG